MNILIAAGFPRLLTWFTAKSLHIPSILTKFAMKLCTCRAIAVNRMNAANLLMNCKLHCFFLFA